MEGKMAWALGIGNCLEHTPERLKFLSWDIVGVVYYKGPLKMSTSYSSEPLNMLGYMEKVADGIKVVRRLIWDEEIILNYLGWPNVITQVLTYGKGSRWENLKGGNMRRIWPDVLSLRMEKGATRQEIWTTSRSCKKQKKDSPEPLERNAALMTSWF